MTYMKYICAWLREQPIGKPIFLADIGQAVSKDYKIGVKEASAAVSVAVKRILEGNILPELRFYKKGIYYRTEMTAFGEIGIDKAELIADRYLAGNNGYETGLTFLHRLGLASQLPSNEYLATNRVRAARTEKNLNIVLCPSRTIINESNKDYLQTLDAIELLGKAPVDAENPYSIMAKHIQNLGLSYQKLLALADKFYNKHTICELARTASEGDVY